MMTGGKVKRRSTRKTSQRVATALRPQCWPVLRGAFYRRIKARQGARRLWLPPTVARIVYHLLKHRTDYQDPGVDYYNQQQRERTINRLRKIAAKYDMVLQPQSSFSGAT